MGVGVMDVRVLQAPCTHRAEFLFVSIHVNWFLLEAIFKHTYSDSQRARSLGRTSGNVKKCRTVRALSDNTPWL